MSGSVNKVILVGYLGADPEVRYTPSGQPVANFRVATNEEWTKDGEKYERTEWHRCVVWGKLAELCGQYLHKGRQIYIEGKLQTREWTDRDDVKRYTTEIQGLNVTFLGGAKHNQEAEEPKSSNKNKSRKSSRRPKGKKAEEAQPAQTQQEAPADAEVPT